MSGRSGDSCLSFAPLTRFKKGLLFFLLSRSYQALLNDDQLKHQEELIDDWKEFDEAAFQNPKTIGRCVFVTLLGREAIGFGSHNPRRWPETGIVGHNCILPGFRGHGYGRAQIRETIERLRKQKFIKAGASTGDHPFFLPAQKMYLSCGFREAGRFRKPDMDFSEINYERYLCPKDEDGNIPGS
jgi:GNAT superfamily N-acetyltransferase